MATVAEISVRCDLTDEDIIPELLSFVETFDTNKLERPAISGNPEQPKPKRVRREKVELDQLRFEAHKLQTELNQLQGIQKCKTMRMKRTFANEQSKHGNRIMATDSKSVWKEVAKHQQDERLRSHTINQELRDRLQAECCLGRQLMTLLHRNTKVRMSPQSRKLPLDDDEAIFKIHLVQAEDSLLEMEKILLQPAFQDPNASFVDTFVRKCGDKKFFVRESNSTLPFTVQVAANAVWNVMGTSKVKDHGYNHHFVHRSDTVLAQTFGIHFTTDASEAHFRTNYTLRRFNDCNRVVIAWVALYEPVELNGLQYKGEICQQIGWMELRDHPLEKTNITNVRSYSRLSVTADNIVQNNEQQMWSLFSIAQQIHEQVEGLFSFHLQEELIEEDWKTHG
ncbi:hypothetical protein PHMEG_0006276 [Phytophthora megakarya]|uniref:M96 mating-specific protein n=1 Tax=Phytophthora megakarya TaxID=4795 RepID=A0A225WPI4_9STRA|nr:hypothetical protein PHMEG_0006276 [Phytophthora megakarya]